MNLRHTIKDTTNQYILELALVVVLAIIVAFLCPIKDTINRCISESALIAVLAIIAALLIPIVFFIMDKNDHYSFDKNVVLDKVLLYKKLLPLILLSSFCLIFPTLLFISALLCVLTVILSAFVLYRSYNWLSANDVKKSNGLTYRQKHRINYLKNLKSDSEILEVWNIILFDEKLLEKNQNGFIDVFIDTCKNKEEKDSEKDNHICQGLLHMLKQNFEKINFATISVYENLVTYLLSYYDAYTIGYEVKKTILFDALKYSLQEKQYRIFDRLFFKCVQKYFDEQNNKTVFINLFFPILLKVLARAENIEINGLWNNGFLKSNTITNEKLTDEKSSLITYALLNVYVEFIFEKIREDSFDNPNDNKKYNPVIDKITQKLLPEIDPILWFDMLYFDFSAFNFNEGEEPLQTRIRNWCTQKRSFGWMGRVVLLHGDDMTIEYQKTSAHREKEERETVFILKAMLKHLNNREELDKVLNMIEKIRKENLFNEQSSENKKLGLLEYNIKLFLNALNE